MAAPESLLCAEDMMDETPDIGSDLEERQRYQSQFPPELICHQDHKEITAFSDNTLLKDPRVFPSMLEMEKVCVGYVNNYFRTIQDDLTPSMKRDVGIWMFEVCDEEHMNTAVFIRAAQYMDKFLSIQRISRTQLQLLGAVCILISSKMAGTLIPARTLVSYTANSITCEMLLAWEGMVLGKLEWDMSGIVSADFVQHILSRIPKNLWDTRVIYERIKTFISYCAVDYQLGVHLPSTVASASIVAAMAPFLSDESMNLVLSTIHATTKIDLNHLQKVMEQITTKVQLTVEGRRQNLDAPCVDSDPEAVATSAPNTSANGCGIMAR